MRRWPFKPPLGTPINWGHPVAAGLRAYVPMLDVPGEAAPMEVLRRVRLTATAAPPSWAHTQQGPARRYTYAGATQRADSLSGYGIASPLTVAVRFQVTSSPGQRGICGVANSVDSGTPSLLLAYGRTANKIDYYTGAYTTGAIAVGLNQWYTAVCAYDGAAWTFYINGHQDGTRTTALGADRNLFGLGSGFGGTVEGEIAWAALWGRALSRQDAQELTANPYCLLATPRRLWVVYESPAEEITGTIAASIAAPTSASVAALGFTGTVAAAIGAPVTASTAALGFTGTAAAGIPAPGAAASASLGFSAAAAASVPAPGASTAAALEFSAAAAPGIPAPSATAAASLGFSGTVSASVSAPTSAATAETAVSYLAEIAVSVPGPTCAADATYTPLAITGTVGASISAPVCAASAQADVPAIEGTIAASIPAATAAASAALGFTGTAAGAIA
ncbi:MAG TPA: LamG-like jellyroll fold domain-containing protein, partial [Candidatus Omnitrophota bacterium]|nr:LamG-like jellyroll fold domain-containing protein [Candidatus Omnitrophota bacterium]